MAIVSSLSSIPSDLIAPTAAALLPASSEDAVVDLLDLTTRRCSIRQATTDAAAFVPPRSMSPSDVELGRTDTHPVLPVVLLSSTDKTVCSMIAQSLRSIDKLTGKKS